MCVSSHALAEIPYPLAEAHQKRFVMEFRRADGLVLGVELVVARPEDEGRSPIEVLEKQVGQKWGGFAPGIVYRFDPRSKPRTWEPIMFRDMRSTETRVGEGRAGLKISELKSGDVIILYAPSP
jgi:hypothetical protein